MQRFRYELMHPALATPIVLHSVGAFSAPSVHPKDDRVFWFSARDAPDVIVDGGVAQPSRQLLPAEALTRERPMTVRVLLNGHEVFTGNATQWDYNDYKHQCFMRFGPMFAMCCDEDELPAGNRRRPFHSYWRDLTEPRHVGIVEIYAAFFTPTVCACFN